MKKKRKPRRKNEDYSFEQAFDDTFYFIAGYTSGGAPYGLTWNEIISQELVIRQAEKKDAMKAAELIHLAIGDIAERLTGFKNTKKVRNVLELFFREHNNRISFQNVLVADVYDEVVGLVISYPGDDAALLDEPLLNRLRKNRANQKINFDKEAEPGDYYIDTLSVYSQYQGYGIGTKLIEKAEETAKFKGYQRVSLNVASDNASAKRLYKKLGYVEEKTIQINGHKYDYMVKILQE